MKAEENLNFALDFVLWGGGDVAMNRSGGGSERTLHTVRVHECIGALRV